MVDVRGDVLRPPHGTTPSAVKSNLSLPETQVLTNHLGNLLKNINRIIASDDTDDSQIPSLLTGNLSIAELNAAIKSLPLDKAPSRDNITYEHIIYGGETLSVCLNFLTTS